MSPHHTDQMSQWSQVSRIALCMAKVKVSDSVSESVSELVTRSPIELFWTAKNRKNGPWCLPLVSLGRSYQYETHCCWLYLLRKPACSGPSSHLSPVSADVNILLLPQPPYSSTLAFWWSLRGGGSFGAGEGGDCGGCGGAGDDGAGTRSVGWHCALIFLAALPLPLPAAQSVCSPSTVNIVHLHLANHDALPSLPWRNNMGEGNEVLLAPKLRQNLHQCTNARTAPAPMHNVHIVQ